MFSGTVGVEPVEFERLPTRDVDRWVAGRHEFAESEEDVHKGRSHSEHSDEDQPLSTALDRDGRFQRWDDGCRRCIQGGQGWAATGNDLDQHLGLGGRWCSGFLSHGGRVTRLDGPDGRVDLDAEHAVGDAGHHAVARQLTGVNLAVEQTAELVVRQGHAVTGPASNASLMKAPTFNHALPLASTSAQSRMKPSKPRSVRGWLISWRKVLAGMVAVCAPSWMHWSTCVGWRTEAARTFVSRS